MASKATATSFTGVRVEVSTPLSFDKVLDRLRKLMGAGSFDALVALAGEPLGQAAFVDEVERRFVGDSDFMLFAEFNHGAWLSKFNIHRRTIRLILGNPVIAITMIRHDISAGLFAPVEVLVTEHSDHNGATITYVRPSSLMVVAENPPLKNAAEKLDAKLAALIESATDP